MQTDMVIAAEGARVLAGDRLMVVEAMKMEHEVTAPADRTLAQLLVTVGMHVEVGATLAVIAESD